MFERFTQDARDVVVDAKRLAGEGRWHEIRNEHLMLAVLRRVDSPGVRALAAAGLTDQARATAADDFVTLNRRAGISGGDAEALRGIGIDVDEVLDRMEELAGGEEVDPQPEDRGGPFGRGRKRESFGGSPRFSEPAKYTLERALREAIHLRHRHIDDAHIVLGLLSRPGAVTETLERYGVTHAAVRRAVTTRAQAG